VIFKLIQKTEDEQQIRIFKSCSLFTN